MAHDVFISYSQHDKPQADAICAGLEARGIRCWIAPRDVVPGSDYAESILDGIEGAKALVIVFSDNANKSAHLKKEVERAVNKGVSIIPVRIEDVAPSRSMEYFISTQHWLDALTPPLEEHIGRLAEGLTALLKKPRAESSATGVFRRVPRKVAEPEGVGEAAAPAESAAATEEPATAEAAGAPPASEPEVAGTPVAPERKPRWLLPAAVAVGIVLLALIFFAGRDGAPTEETAPTGTAGSVTAEGESERRLRSGADDLQTVLSGYYEALGGLQAIQSVQSAFMTGTMSAAGNTMSFVTALKRPLKVRTELTAGGTTFVEAFDGVNGWTFNPMQGQYPVPMTPLKTKFARWMADMQGPLVDYRSKGIQVRLTGTEVALGQQTIKLEVRMPEGDLVYIYLDPTSKLQVLWEGPGLWGEQPAVLQTLTSDYRNVGGLVLPHYHLTRPKGGVPGDEASVTIDSVQLNVDLADSFFTLPQ